MTPDGSVLRSAPFVKGECDIMGCRRKCLQNKDEDRWFPHYQTGSMRLCVEHRKEEFPRG